MAIGRLLGRARRARGWVREASAPAEPLDLEALESRLVWILGSPRTGSTWLLEQLCDPLRVTGRRLIGASLPDGSKPLDALPVNELQLGGHLAPAFAEPSEIEGRYIPGTLNAAMSTTPGYLLSEDYGDVWRPLFRRLVLARLEAQRREAARRLPLADAKLIVKDVNSSYVADLVMSLFPRSRLVFLVRDGRDVVDSLLHAEGPGGWFARRTRGRSEFTTEDERLEWVRVRCRRWMCDIDAASRAYDGHDPARRLALRYEDLRADPVASLRALADWAGLDRDERRLRDVVEAHAFERIPAERRGSLHKHRAATPGLWRENLTEAERRVAHEVMGRGLAQLGYA